MAKASISMETVEKRAPSDIQKVNLGMEIFVLSYFKHPGTRQMQCPANVYGTFCTIFITYATFVLRMQAI